jgi:thiosulfate/3-mercaptopyruvate sulfurtransferase
MTEGFAHPEYLVEPDWLAARLDDPTVRVLDVTGKLTSKRVNRAREDCFDVAHIPGAVFVDAGGANGEFHDPDAALPWTWASPQRFAELMGRCGVGNDTHVVLAASTPRPGIDSGTMWCTRTWWTMHHLGVRCSILLGGMERWQAEGRPVTADPTVVEPAVFKVADGWQRGRADRHDVLAALGRADACVLDALSAETFAGTGDAYGPRKGHITGAVNLPFRSLIEAETAGFVDAGTMRGLLEQQGLLGRDEVVAYCGGAIAATTAAFALALFGRSGVSVYDGSLLEWAADDTLPMTDPSAAAGAAP